MNKKITFITDYFLEDCFGGAELVDEEIIQGLLRNGYNVLKVRCQHVTEEHLNSDLLISNFATLPIPTMRYIVKNCRYSIIEHDHKYLLSRNVALHKNYIVPPHMVVNQPFYYGAVKVFCQAKAHAEVVTKNLGLTNIVNLSTSIWSDKELDILEKNSSKPKNNKTMVLGSPNKIKNTPATVNFCKENGIDYEVVGPLPWPELMSKMAEFSEVLFLPTFLESFNRFIVEAKMLGCRVKTNNKNGCTSEEWFSKFKGKELIDFMRASKPKFIEKLIPQPPANADKFNALFDKTYLINLATREDRLQRTKKRLGDLGIVYERFEAIDGKTQTPTQNLNPGEVGCYMSHYKILEDAKKNGYGSILVLEDDVVFENNALERFYNGLEHIPDDWEMIYLGANHNMPYTRINEHIVQCNHAFTTSAIIIRGSALEKLINESKNMTKQIDVVYADLQAAKKLKAYAFNPWLIYQEDGYSDIQGRHMSYTSLMRK